MHSSSQANRAVRLRVNARGSVGGWPHGCSSGFIVAPRSKPRLAVLERISLAPRQTLALIEADGQRLLVATSPEGTPASSP